MRRESNPALSSPHPTFTERLKRAFREFLDIPLTILLSFLFFAILVYALDRNPPPGIAEVRAFLESYIFPQPGGTKDFISLAVTGVMTMTSITISMLLLALQQSAGTMGNLVFDQYLDRKRNQIYLGTFVGIAVFGLVMRAPAHEGFNPVLGASFTLIFTIFSLGLLIMLLFTTIHQMRPEVVIGRIHDRALDAREKQLPIIWRTRRESQFSGDVSVPVRSQTNGFVTGLDLDVLSGALEEVEGEAEVVFEVIIGSYVSYHDVVAYVLADDVDEAAELKEAVLDALALDRQRNNKVDARYGIQGFETIAWTSGSTSKQNPETALMAIRYLRDVMARWMAVDREVPPDVETLPVVLRDNVMFKGIETFESLAVAASESMQHQTAAAVIFSLACLTNRMSPELLERSESAAVRIVGTLERHVLTELLEKSLKAFISELRAIGRLEVADELEEAMWDRPKAADSVQAHAQCKVALD